MKLNASTLPVKPEVVDVHKLSSLITAGQMVEFVNGSRYRVTSKIAGDDGISFRLESSGNSISVTANQLADMGPLPPGLARLAHVLRRFAYNKDFDEYVKTAIRDHGLPVDEVMKWDKFFQAIYVPMLSKFLKSNGLPADDDIIDEIIHATILNALYQRDSLAKFNNKKNEDQYTESEARQVTKYLGNLFEYEKVRAKRLALDLLTVTQGKQDPSTGIRERLDVPVEQMSPGDEEDTEVNILDTMENATPSEAPEIESWEDIARFRRDFYEWLKETEREETADNVIKLFNLIIEAEQEDVTSSRADYMKKWMENTGKSLGSFKVVASKLEKALSAFVKEHPEVAESSLLARLIADIESKKPTTERKVEGKPTPVAASLHLADWPPFDFEQPDGDTGHLPHDNTGNTGNEVVVVDEEPEEQPQRTVAPEIPVVKHGTA
jgi:hypothetical protein